MQPVRKFIPISSLILSDDNPRLNLYDDTQNIIIEMIENQQDKLYVLAEDILNYGLCPLDLWAVYPSKTDNNMFKIAEGNRRLTSLILLNNPLIIKDINARIYSRFTDLLTNSKNQPPKEVECVVFKDWEDENLQHWIQLRHLGLSKGKGTDTWDSVQKSRYEQKMYGVNALLDFWDELIDLDILDNHQIRSIKKTNWERILNKKGRDYLGILKNGDKYIIPRSDTEIFTLKIRKVAEKLANETVAKVYDNDRIQELLDDINRELFGDGIQTQAPTLSFSDEKTKLTEDRTIDSLLNSETPISLPNIGQKSITPTKDIFDRCKTIIPYKHSIRSSHERINKIINELKYLDVDQYPNACGSLCRLLFELSAKYYIMVNKIDFKEDDITKLSFSDAIKLSLNHQKINKKIADYEHSALSKDTETLRLLFNGYMHSTTSYPSSLSLQSLFKAHQKFISVCLEK